MRRFFLVSIVCCLTVISSTAGELSFSNFQYITDHEVTIFGDRIKFFNGDTLWWWIHSNDQFAIMQSPVFYGPVTTSSGSFWIGPGYNPQFSEEVIYNYPEAVFPEEAAAVREAALQSGTFFLNPGEQYQFRAWFKGQLGVEIWRWDLGIPFSDTLGTLMASYPPDYNGRPVFLSGRTELIATVPEFEIDYGIAGRYTIGASGDIYIMGNLRYIDSDLILGIVDSTTTNCLGVVSESNIIIANTWENGRDNGNAQGSSWFKDVIMNGAFLALGESFTFADQNDDTIAYGGALPSYYYSEGTTPDERGAIHLWGSLAQSRRGYVHRSNHGGTGYLKDYHYYHAIRFDPPPYFPYQEIELTLPVDFLNFAATQVGDTLTMEFPFYNDSMDSISLENMTITGNAYSAYIQPDSLFCPNDTSIIEISFHPQTAGDIVETLTMNTTYEGSYTITLFGYGLGVGVDNPGVLTPPEEFRLVSVYPNPFNRETVFRFNLPEEAELQLKIFDLTGRIVYESLDTFPAGEHIWEWSPANLASGIYFYQLSHPGGRSSGKILFLQ